MGSGVWVWGCGWLEGSTGRREVFTVVLEWWLGRWLWDGVRCLGMGGWDEGWRGGLGGGGVGSEVCEAMEVA